MTGSKAAKLLLAVSALMAVIFILFISPRRRQEPVSVQVEAKVLKKIEGGLSQALHQERALASLNKQEDKSKSDFSMPSGYQDRVHQYLEVTLPPKVEDESVASRIVDDLIVSLRSRNVSSSDQDRILYRAGKYFYHQALFSGFEGYPPTVKVRLLRLAIEHLNKTKRRVS